MNRLETLVKMVANTDEAIHPLLTKEIRPLRAVGPDMEFLQNYPIVPDYDCSSVEKDGDNPLDLTDEEALYLAKLNDIITTDDIDPKENITRRELCHRLFLARLVRKDGQLLNPSVREPVARMYLPVENKPVGRFINNPAFPRLPPLKGQDRLYVEQLSNSVPLRHVSTGYFKGKKKRKSIKKLRNKNKTRKTIKKLRNKNNA